MTPLTKAEVEALVARVEGCRDLASNYEFLKELATALTEAARERDARGEAVRTMQERLANATQSTVEMGAEILRLRESVSELAIKRRVDREHYLVQRALVEAERDALKALRDRPAAQGSAMQEIVRVLDKLPPHERVEVIRATASIYNFPLGAGRAEAPAPLRGEARDRDPQGDVDQSPGSAGSPAPGAGRTDGLDRGEA